MTLKQSTIKLDNKIWKEIKMNAIKKGMTQNELLTEYIEQGLKNESS